MNDIDKIRDWFQVRGLTDAVVGYSGGIDSTVTALLLHAAGIEVTLVVADAPNQTYSSPWGGQRGAIRFCHEYGLPPHHLIEYPHLFGSDTANEAALPIMRNAAFYGVAAVIRENGGKPVVVGTANMSEAGYLGFWGKASDAAQDFYPISHLYKREVYAWAAHLKAPKEIVDAIPSGDLLFSSTNDHTMIGATYTQIDHVMAHAEFGSEGAVKGAIQSVDNPEVFMDNILRNRFKYDLPFPNFHLTDRLERFRQRGYPLILQAIEEIKNA